LACSAENQGVENDRQNYFEKASKECILFDMIELHDEIEYFAFLWSIWRTDVIPGPNVGLELLGDALAVAPHLKCFVASDSAMAGEADTSESKFYLGGVMKDVVGCDVTAACFVYEPLEIGGAVVTKIVYGKRLVSCPDEFLQNLIKVGVSQNRQDRPKDFFSHHR
jgi:hypothetical protein